MGEIGVVIFSILFLCCDSVLNIDVWLFDMFLRVDFFVIFEVVSLVRFLVF